MPASMLTFATATVMWHKVATDRAPSISMEFGARGGSELLGSRRKAAPGGLGGFTFGIPASLDLGPVETRRRARGEKSWDVGTGTCQGRSDQVQPGRGITPQAQGNGACGIVPCGRVPQGRFQAEKTRFGIFRASLARPPNESPVPPDAGTPDVPKRFGRGRPGGRPSVTARWSWPSPPRGCWWARR